ncbi:hypothetical protein, partial [Puniceibacterium antarcticum]|uniref:hypothetical protein n=1 Tax=Puniceibacterium antarcticum TaxID=1206336 RepID=UPI001C5585EB
MKDHSQGRVLIVGGAAEARVLARRVPGALVLLGEAERVVRDWPAALQRGMVCADWLRAQGVGAVIEAA